jgi:hypothetical protein
MGIRTDPGYGLYVPGAEECFPAGLTPKKLYCTLSGVERGASWNPSQGSCMNRTYIAEWTVKNYWKWLNGNAAVTVFLSNGACNFIVDNEVPRRVFESDGISACGFESGNRLHCPGFYFCGGFFTITVREPIEDVPSIQNVQNLIGVPRAPKTFAEISLDDTGKRIVRLARQSDGTCIRIKYSI